MLLSRLQTGHGFLEYRFACETHKESSRVFVWCEYDGVEGAGVSNLCDGRLFGSCQRDHAHRACSVRRCMVACDPRQRHFLDPAPLSYLCWGFIVTNRLSNDMGIGAKVSARAQNLHRGIG